MSDHIAPPSRFHQLLEGRVGMEISALMMQLPLLRLRVPTGEGRVIVLPGQTQLLALVPFPDQDYADARRLFQNLRQIIDALHILAL